MKIAIAGKAGSGKSTAAKHLVNEYGFERMSLAAKLKEICSLHGVWGTAKRDNFRMDTWTELEKHVFDLFPKYDESRVELVVGSIISVFDDYEVVEGKNRALLQCVGTDVLREIEETVWADYLIRKTREHENVVVDDVRFRNEFDAFKEDGWTMVLCAVPDDVRAKRLEACYGRPLTEEEASHPSERDLDDLPAREWDWILNTAGAVETEKTQVDELISYVRGADNA